MSEIRIGMVGLDTSHCEAFVNVLNHEDDAHHVPGGRIVAAFPGGSELTSISRDRVAGFTEKLRDEHGIAMFDSLEELAAGVDAISLNSVDGRQHLEQFRVLSKFGKPVFIDKPLACSYEDAKQIVEMAALTQTPIMSASSIRYSAGVTGLAGDDKVGSCEAFGTMSILDDYPTYFWYAVHGADLIFSYLGRGCRTVRAIHGAEADLLVGIWEDGRIGTVRGLRFGPYHFGCTVHTSGGTRSALASEDPPGYALMLQKIVPFFETGRSPIDAAEMLEVMAFLDAAGESERLEGESVDLPG